MLNPSATRQNTIFVVVRISDMEKVSKLQFHTDKGHMIDMLDVDHKKEQCYVLLSIVQINKNCQKSQLIILNDNLVLMKRFFINQILVKKCNYHFNTTSTIYRLGYGPKSNRNMFGHSIGKFANHR